MKIALARGLELTLQPVSQVALDEIITDMEGYELQSALSKMNDTELRAHFATYTHAEMSAYLEAQHRQMLYCFGWGVVDNPPEAAQHLLENLGLAGDLPQIQRARWLIYAADLTRTDKATIIGNVLAVTYAAELRRNDGRD
jgi:hypothetical protein